MVRRTLLAILAVFTSVATAQAQAGGRVTGTVTAAEGGRPIPLVQVTVTGTARGALTDSAGRFTITGVPAGTQSVLARSIGWGQGSKEVTVVAGQAVTANRARIRADDAEPARRTGYGDVDRRVVGAVATVSAEKLMDIPPNPMKSLQGRVAGVEIVVASNEPGSAMNVRIRGVRSLTASNDPLSWWRPQSWRCGTSIRSRSNPSGAEGRVGDGGLREPRVRTASSTTKKGEGRQAPHDVQLTCTTARSSRCS
jgi:hypothetical protein